MLQPLYIMKSYQIVLIAPLSFYIIYILLVNYSKHSWQIILFPITVSRLITNDLKYSLHKSTGIGFTTSFQSFLFIITVLPPGSKNSVFFF